jgi:SNF2 family DNA or RNA helicase
VLRGIIFGSRDLELILTSYQTLANGENDFRVFLEDSRRRVMMVLDEAHNVKREDGYWANAALRLAPLAWSRVVLTGTPAPNGYEDLFNLFRFIYPERQLLGFPLPTLKAMSDGHLSKAVPALKANIRPFYTRIRKSDLGLPEVVEHRVQIQMSPIHEKIYRSIERRIVPQLRVAYGAQGGQSAIRLKARLIRLRQAAVNPELLLRPILDEELFNVGRDLDFNVAELEVVDAIRSFEPAHDLARLAVCTRLVQEVLDTQGKVLVWSYFLERVMDSGRRR